MKIKSEEFQYPTTEERRRANAKLPKFSNFEFEYKSEIEMILNPKLSNKEIETHSNLFYWDNCLGNRLGKLRETYIYVLVNHFRGFEDDYSKINSSCELTNHFLFDYYSEIFYYYYFSSIDIILQIIRLYYSIDIPENKLHLNKLFFSKSKNKEINEVLNKFANNTKETSYIRNTFTHRFTPNLPDNKLYIQEEINGQKLTLGTGDFIKSQKLIDNMINSLHELSLLTMKIKRIIRHSDTD